MSRNDETKETSTDIDATDIDFSRQTTQPSQLPALSGAAALGRYIVGDQVGAGGTGVVFRGHDPELKRDVAIKLVVPRQARDRERLLAEARAMAKLDHRAVMPVFDVGLTNDGVYIVMPHIVGGTLDEWLRAAARPWREVLERFLEAGRGLAAAHAAGLVHRDFKPLNVLVDGNQVVVADFGLVAGSASDASNDGAPTTNVAGTPGYMAPEQASGGSVDARADQYSFCVSLWEALCGERPTETPSPSSGKRLPRWLLPVLVRGLERDPAARWPSLQTLLDHLERRIRRRRAVPLALGLIGLVTATVVAMSLVGDRGKAPCHQPHERLSGAWDAIVHDGVRQAFASVTGAQSESTLARTWMSLDRYARSWRMMHVHACQATHISRTQTPEVFDRRMSCLERHLGLLRVLTTTLADSRDAKLLVRAPELVGGLPAIGDCAATDQLMAQAPLPADAEVRRKVAALQEELDQIVAMKWRGEHSEQLRRAQAAVGAARLIGYSPGLARALLLLQFAESDAGKHDTATSRELAQVASLAGMDKMSAHAWLTLMRDLTTSQVAFEEARAIEKAAHVAILRAGSPKELLFLESWYGGLRAFNSGEYALSRERLHAARRLTSSANTAAEIDANLARIALILDGPSIALPMAETAVKSFESAFGPDHAFLSDHLMFLAQVESAVGNFEAARATAQRALAIQSRTVPADSEDLGITLTALAGIEHSLGRTDDALELNERAAAIFEKGGNAPRHALAVGRTAEIIAERDGLSAARPYFERSLAELAPVMGKDWVFYVYDELAYARALVEGGACRETPPLIEHAMRVFEKESPPFVGWPLWLRARCHIAAHRIDAAIADLDESDRRCRSGDCQIHAETLWTLGTLLVERSRDRERGVALVREARAMFETRGQKARVSEADAWLAKY